MSTSIGGNSLVACECGKAHFLAYIGPTSVCTCGANLWSLIIARIATCR